MLAAQVRAMRVLQTRRDLLAEVGQAFADAGHELSLVGGIVRDALMDRSSADVDLTTDARPDRILEVLGDWPDAVWDVGARFGTIGARKGDVLLEITTYRTDQYSGETRKPEVAFGDSLEEDLRRRDFTVNSIAVTLPDMRLVDPFGGQLDLVRGVIRTPSTAHESFSDDPLRMLRAARFASQLGFVVAPDVFEAMSEMSERLEIISAERVREEFSKLILGDNPRLGLHLLVETGLADRFLPELPALKLEIDEHHRHKDVYEHSLVVLEQAIGLESTHEPTSGPDLVLRLAALLHDIGKPRTRRFEDRGGVSFHHHEVVGARMTTKRMKAMRYSNDEIEAVSALVELHLRFHGYSGGEWTDSAVRRYVRDAGELLPRLHKLTRADCTTRNKRKAASLQRTYDSLENRIGQLAKEEEIAAVRPDLDGKQIMEILDLAPGPEVGQAYKYLLDVRLDVGPLSPEEAKARLLEWWASRNG